MRAIVDKGKKVSNLSPEIEEQAQRAVETAENVGPMIVVKCPHSKCAPITTRIAIDQIEQNVLILSENGETNYFGDGDTCRELQKNILQKLGLGLVEIIMENLLILVLQMPISKKFWNF